MPVVTVEIEFINDKGERHVKHLDFMSMVVKDFLKKGVNYSPDDFKKKALSANKEAGRRVMEKYGFNCEFCSILEDVINYIADHSKRIKIIDIY